jgi:hypothetical protein
MAETFLQLWVACITGYAIIAQSQLWSMMRTLDATEERLRELEREPVILPFPKPDELRSYD